MSSERRVNLQELQQYLTQVRVNRPVREVIIHHTWRPTAAQYQGATTVAGVRRYHTQTRGWSDNGYHLMIAPNGDLYLCRPLQQAGAHCLGRNAGSVGVSFIADFDAEDPAGYPGLAVGQQAVALLLRRFGLGAAAVRFHREFAAKTCPGRKLDLAAFRREVARRLDQGAQPPQVVLLPEGRVLPCRAQVEAGVTRADLRPLLEGAGLSVRSRLREENRVYVGR